MTLRRIFEVSTHVTKSSMFLVTWKLGSLTTFGPTLTCPCSINVTASRKVSLIFKRTMTTDNRLLKNDDVESLSHNVKDFVLGIAPIVYSLSKSFSVISTLSGSLGSI